MVDKIVKSLYSTTGGNVPSSLEVGQFATNLVDKRIFNANATSVFDAFQNTVANISITTSNGALLRVGNSTVNVAINSTSISIFSNSTVSWTLTAPTASQISAGNYFPGSNGLWQQVTGGGGGGSPGGSNTNIQINDSGSFYGSNAFSFDKTSNTVNLDGGFVANADAISLGNTSVNTVINSLGIFIGNSSVTGSLSSTALSFGVSSLGSASQTNGYSSMPNGLIFQWGYVAGVNATAGTVTFPLPFPTACFSCVIVPSVTSANVWVSSVNATVAAVRSTGAANVYYMAIGK